MALYLKLFPMHQVVPLKKDFANFPINWKGWEGSSYYFDSDVLDKLRVSEYIMRGYTKGADKVNIYIGYYGTQKKDAQIHSPKHCLPGSGWFELSETKKSLDINGVGKMDFVEAVYQKGKEKEIFVYWYKMKDTYITNEYILKLYMIFNSLKYRRNDAAFIRISAPITNDVVSTEKTIEQFMKDFLPLLKEYLPE